MRTCNAHRCCQWKRSSTGTLAAAKQALAELLRAKKSCPTKRTADGVAGRPPIKHRFNRIPRGLKAVPGVQRVTLDITESDAHGNGGTELNIYQRRGSIVVAVYGALPYANDYIAPGIGGMAGLANTLAQRLLAAPQPGSVT